MKLNSFGETVRRIEAERLEEARQAVADGWTEADHPAKCCGPVEAPRRAGKAQRATEEIERLRDKAQEKTRYWQGKTIRLQEELEQIDANSPKFDHGMLQLPLSYRRKGIMREHAIWKEREHATERANHFRHLVAKYSELIERRSET